ncbi:MAG TPA: hypothetical protein VGX23_20850 [Actinocrinis sp.]|nr:hypothetical protein [Actinocrinis sp.]
MSDDGVVRPEPGTVAGLRLSFIMAMDAKMMSEYSRDLLWRSPAIVAYRNFRSACLERTANGIPPYTAMPRDLRQLAAEAKMDTPDEDAAFARDLLVRTAVPAAPSTFWNAYRRTLVRAAKHDPDLNAVLVQMLPAMPGLAFEASEDLWLDILEDCDTLDSLVGPAASKTTVENATAWLQRFIGRDGGDDADDNGETYFRKGRLHGRKLPGLVERMAPRLLAERDTGARLTLCDRRGADVALIDLWLGLGLRLDDPTDDFEVDLPGWLRRESRRDLTASAGDPRIRPALLREFVRMTTASDGDKLGPLVRRVAAAPGLRDVVGEWLAATAEVTVSTDPAGLNQALDTWVNLDYEAIAGINPGN